MPAPAPAPVARLGWAQVAAWRAARHHLDERAPAGAILEVAARIAGVHAQVLSSAELTLWARVEGLALDAVRHALWDERSLVKTWAMRGTLHLLPAAEFPLWQAALSTRRPWEARSWQRGFGVSLDQLERLNAAVAEALDGRQLTREELATRVGELTTPALGDKLRESWGALLKPAAALGLLCFAPGQGQQVRFTRPDTWLGGWTGHDPEAAMDTVTRRFLAASGPITREDFARWWGIPSPDRAARLLQRLGEEVARVDVVVTATRQAERLMPGPFKARVYRPQGWLSPVLLVGGRMEGVWRHEARGRRLVVTIEPFAGPPARVRRAAEAEAERLAAFSGAELELRWADPAAPGG